MGYLIDIYLGANFSPPSIYKQKNPIVVLELGSLPALQ